MFGEKFTYEDDGKACHGFLAYDDTHKESRPVVMIVPAFEGLTDTYRDMAKEVAKKGYVALVVDMYGDGQVGHDLESCLGHMMPHFEDRALLRQRILAAYKAVETIEVADAAQVAIMGFCFGGMVALDLARAGVDIKAAVSIHGVLAPPEGVSRETINAKILVLHGYLDPQIPPEAVAPFAEEMQSHDVDWQVHFFGDAKHAFTDPHAAKIGAPEMGREYNELATKRSWQACYDLFSEVFA